MRSEFAFLFPQPVKVRKPRKAAAKAIKIGARIILAIDGNEYTVAERDARYKNSWFIVNDAGKRAPCSFSRDVMKVL